MTNNLIVACIKEWASAKEAFDILPEDCHLDPAKMDILVAAINRKNDAEKKLMAIARDVQ